MDSQFGLTLELTRLIPLTLIGNATQQAVMALARQLKNSGSDILIEQDLAQLFGRSRIDPRMESNFRSLVGGGRSTPLTNEIRLSTGQGPTVARAFKERPYFSTLVQLSLLTSVCNKNNLAHALVEILENKYNHAPNEYLSPPDEAGVLGTLKVYEEETSLFSWNHLLRAVCAVLGEHDPFSFPYDHLQQIHLQGLLDMLPIVQTLPLDRMIHVKYRSSIAVMVVWAHHVLGLTVVVKNKHSKTTRFGEGCEQLYFEHSNEDSITLYASSGCTRDVLYFLQSSGLETDISLTFRRELHGYGKSVLDDECGKYSCSAALAKDMAALTVAITCLVHSALDSGNGRFFCSQPDNAAQKRIWEASNVFFGFFIDQADTNVFMDNYRTKRLDSTLPPPAIFETASDELGNPGRDVWGELLHTVKSLASILLAVSYVDNIQACAALPCKDYRYSTSPLTTKFHGWDGISPITIREGTIFEFLTLLLGVYIPEEHIDKVALVSKHGWSIYLTSFNDEDPASLTAERVKVARGTPYRNDVRINSIIDGPFIRTGSRARTIVKPGQSLTSRNLSAVHRGKSMFSLEGDHTTALLLFESKADNEPSSYTWVGYRSLHGSLCSAQPTESCIHGTNRDFTLPQGCAAFNMLPPHYEHGDDVKSTRILITLTEDSPDARWQALTDSHRYPRRTLLRSNNCCAACAVSQAAAETGEWIVIL